MNRVRRLKFLAILATAGLVLHAPAVLACAACYGKSDSPLASGMNWGIFSLLGVIGAVLGGLTSFFVFLAKRSATIPEINPPDEPHQA